MVLATPEIADTFAGFFTIRIIVICLSPKTAMARVLLFVIIIVMIESTPEVFLAGANLISIGVIVVKTALEVFHTLANLISVGIVVNGLPHKSLATISLLFHVNVSNLLYYLYFIMHDSECPIIPASTVPSHKGAGEYSIPQRIIV